MNKIQKVAWWASISLNKPHVAPDTDYADMGTAFGLDASLPATRPADGLNPALPGDAGPSTDRLNRRSVI